MKKILFLAGVLIFLTFSASHSVTAEPSSDAAAPSKIVPGAKALASANWFSNLRSHENSLKVKVKTLLEEALEKKKDSLPISTKILFDVVPQRVLSDYSDKQYCKDKLQETGANPILYSKNFKEIDEFKDWFADFSQGKGGEGKDLYKKCDKSCSPAYSIEIEGNLGMGLKTNTEVVCGHARDKEDDQYKLRYNFSCFV